MTPAARTQAAIELLDAILAAAREQGAAADTIIARYFAARRYAGSKDRRAVRALVYAAVRRFGDPPASGRAAMLGLAADDPELRATFDGSGYGPALVAPGEPVAEPAIASPWLVEAFEQSGLGAREQAALLERAPLDLRVNRLKGNRDSIRIKGAEPLDFAPDALRLAADTQVERLPEWQDGRIEVQDAGSQLAASACGAGPGMRVIDLCAGGGGKTLALAAAMADRGAILACDADRGRLSRLPPRAERASVSIVETRLLDPGREAEQLADQAERADIVLVDAPCSGTGTWRRNPEARWRLTLARLDRLAETQARLLEIAAPLVRAGGALVHVVCSVLDAEGADQAERFLARHSGWRAEPPGIPGEPRGAGVRLTPASHSTDGFFVARMRAPC